MMGHSDARGGTGPAAGSTIFRTGHNCWTVTRADRAAVRIDAANYFRAFMRACLRARESIFIVGWDFHSRAQLLCEGETLPEDPQAPRLLGDFLNYVAERRRGLRIRILIWDFPSIFGIEREFPFLYGTPLPGAWRPHRRIQVRFDSSHRFAGSHHQKIVVVDDSIAFSGGIDLTRARWDTCAHSADDVHRIHDGKAYSPVHDLMMQVEGETAWVLGHLVRRRWRRAGGAPVLPGPRHLQRALVRRQRAVRAAIDRRRKKRRNELPGARIAISRTYAAGVDRPAQVREVEALFLDMIRAARRWILIENQYFTADVAGRALEERLREPDGPEVVVIVRLLSHGWLEEMTMERLRTQLIRRLVAAGGRRVRVFYPHVDGLGEGHCVDVHSKLMIVDDHYLRVGSANFANRSMGLDSECDLTLEAVSDTDRRFVRSTLACLLAEHLGCEEARVLVELEASGSLIATVDALRKEGARRLEPLPLPEEDTVLPVLASLGDPETPIELNPLRDVLASDDEAARGEQHAHATAHQPGAKRRGWLVVAAVLLLSLGLTLAWRYTPLAERVNADQVIAWARDFGSRPWAPLIVLFAYTPGCWIMFPRPLITLFAVMAFGPWLGFAYSLAGLVIAALMTYFAGYALSPGRVVRLMGPRMRGIVEVLKRRGLIAMTAMRLVPLAPFAVEGLAAGALGIRLWHFAVGSAIGMLPGTLAATVFADQVQALIDPGGKANWPLIGAMAALLLGGAWYVRRWFERQQQATQGGRATP